MGTSPSIATDKFDSVLHLLVPSKCPLGNQRTNIRMVQNVLLIWLDNNIDDNSTECRNTITQFRRIVSAINQFTDSEECIGFLKTMENEKICMVISGSLGEHIVNLIHDMSQVDSIFIFCGNKNYHEQWAKQWSKIKGVFTGITQICEALKKAAQQCEQDAIPINFMATSGDLSNKNLDQLESAFMYTQILKEILLSINFEQKHINEFIQYCLDVFKENEDELKNVKKLELEYHDRTPIWWYTYQCFLYPMLNRALRLMDVELITKMGFFIGDLHRHIEQLHKEQFDSYISSTSFTVYRGQGMSTADFDQMSKTKGGLITFNNFLLTSKNRNASLDFAYNAISKRETVGILFEITVDPVKSTIPFASIIGGSHSQDNEDEDEVLFSIHTVFRIGEITPMNENMRLFHVKLILTSDNDKDLRLLTDRIRKETFPNEEGWYRLGLVLLKMGLRDKAQQVYEILLNQTTNDVEKGYICDRIGFAHYNKGNYQEAITFYEQSLEMYQKTLSPIHPNLAASYNHIGMVYDKIGDYSKALSYYEKAFEIYKKVVPPDYFSLANCYNNIGMVYRKMGDYSRALSYYEKDLEIQQQSLPPNHPDLAKCYNNIGLIYFNMNDYSKALSSQEKSLKIQQQSLPSNHLDLAKSYNNIGLVYREMGDYSEALSYYEKELEINKQLLPPTHPDLGMSYNNIGLMYFKMSNYSKALLSHENALAIRQESLPPNHPDLAASYNNIGLVYNNMGDYSKALSFHEKALAIREKSLSPNHPDLAKSYHNIGLVYANTEAYLKAFMFHKKALAVRQQSLVPNHPDLAESYNNIGLLYHNIGEYSKALSYYEKHLEIQQQSLPSNHPDLGVSYNKIALMYKNMGDYPEALSYYEKELEINKQTLPPNHPDLAASYNNIGYVYYNMGVYSKALSFYERAVNIARDSLQPYHPNLQTYRKNVEDVKKKL